MLSLTYASITRYESCQAPRFPASVSRQTDDARLLECFARRRSEVNFWEGTTEAAVMSKKITYFYDPDVGNFHYGKYYDLGTF